MQAIIHYQPERLCHTLAIRTSILPYRVYNFITGNWQELDASPGDVVGELPSGCLILLRDPGMLKMIAQEISKNGIETDSNDKMSGRLEATEYHLEDMRKLLKLK